MGLFTFYGETCEFNLLVHARLTALNWIRPPYIKLNVVKIVLKLGSINAQAIRIRFGSPNSLSLPSQGDGA